MKRAILAAVMVAALAGGAHAALLQPGELEVSRLLPPPPAPGSPLAVAEIAELHALSVSATPEMIAKAAKDADDQRPDMFNEVLGFDVTKLPATVKLLRTVSREDREARNMAKDFFKRPRPWVADPGIKTCVPVRAGPAMDSYPSGHSGYGFALGTVLAALMPDKAQIILARSAEFARNRMVCGFHYRSDTVGGQVFGTTLAIKLMDNPQFKTEFDAAAAELKAAGK